MIALITGATAGFGLATARLLAKNGYRIIATGRRKDRLEALTKELGEDNCLPLAFDLSDKKATLAALESLPENWQHIDLLVNNAGLALGADPYPNCKLEEWEQMIQTNIIGLITVTYTVLQGMLMRDKGHIINLGSIAGSYPYRGGNIYGSTKAFIKQFSLNLRCDLLGTKIRVSNVEPGMCGNTEFSQVRYHGDEEKVRLLYENIDFITPEDIANSILWIAQCPPHMNINRLEVMPVAQAPAGLAVDRNVKIYSNDD